MTKFGSLVEKRIKSRKEPGKKVFEDITFFLCEGLGISPSELVDMPTPLVIAMSEELVALNKKKTKAAKKKR